MLSAPPSPSVCQSDLPPQISSWHGQQTQHKDKQNERVCSCLVVYTGSCELDVRFEERINPQKNGGPDGIGTQDLPNTTLPVSHWTHSRGVIASLRIVHRLEASANSSCLSLSHRMTDFLDYNMAHSLIPLVNICSSIAFVLVNFIASSCNKPYLCANISWISSHNILTYKMKAAISPKTKTTDLSLVYSSCFMCSPLIHGDHWNLEDENVSRWPLLDSYHCIHPLTVLCVHSAELAAVSGGCPSPEECRDTINW